MKQFLLFACLSIFTLGLNAQVFVDADAAGAGDGTSWADAYTDLNLALLAAAPGSEVWIADGTYTTPDSVSFFINKELTVLGGFNGTEAAAADADPAANVTILSGDVMGNDVVSVYDSLGYVDNNRVLFITDTNAVSAYTVTLDGLTIANGGIAADEGAEDPIAPFSGGGILSFAKLNASRLNFTGNRAYRGSAIALLSSTANESVLDSITVSGNFAGVSRQVYLNGVSGTIIKNSTFTGNPDIVQQSGFIQAAFAQGLTVENSNFSNYTSAFSGAGVRADQSDDVLVSGCTFDNLTASTGGAIYLVQGDDFIPDSEVMDADDFVVDGCIITNCTTPANRGGGITAFNTNIRVANSTVSDNTSGNIGGALYQVPVDARDYVMELTKTTFSGNIDAGAGGAICLLVFGNDNGNAFVEGTIDGCTFSDNVSGNQGSGGVMYLQSGHKFTITNTDFIENVGGFGTVLTRGETGLTVKNCLFQENGSLTDAFQGAGIVAYFNDNSEGLIVDSTSFVENTVTDFGNITSGGAAIYAIGGTSQSVPMEISNSMFMNNAAADGRSGGAMYLIAGFATKIENTEFVGNSAGGDAGAINISIGEATRDTTAEGIINITYEPASVEINNSKFINSGAGTQGGAISTQRVGIDMTNNVFVGNTIGADGFSGGAFIFNGNAPGLDGNGVEVVLGDVAINSTLINNTFVDNFKGLSDGAVGDNIALFMPGDLDNGDSNSMTITLINNAFLLGSGNPSIEVELGQDEPDLGFVPIGNLTVTSMGGNFFNTENGPNIPVFDAATSDLFDENVDYEALFVDLLDDLDMGVNVDLAILGEQGADNPLINNGVTNDMVPATDVRGNPRGENPDIGAYEAEQGAVSTDQPIDESGLALSFFPNPTIDVLNITNEDATITNFHVLVSDQLGRVLKSAKFNGSVNRLDLSTMPSGVYNLRLYVNGKVYSKQVVKQ